MAQQQQAVAQQQQAPSPPQLRWGQQQAGRPLRPPWQQRGSGRMEGRAWGAHLTPSARCAPLIAPSVDAPCSPHLVLTAGDEWGAVTTSDLAHVAHEPCMREQPLSSVAPIVNGVEKGGGRGRAGCGVGLSPALGRSAAGPHPRQLCCLQSSIARLHSRSRCCRWLVRFCTWAVLLSHQVLCATLVS